ncbi:hypothetical protein EJ06DRAFT_493618 [Trichodelitschia bisporula]|uniref:HECT-type E3 ubiquitin transferase n=1 Tax=Trichodelitschia bisporula TaxID=703511 RepID=A0A6G1HYI6_9PEZI|nr:hypothetical protein EJ06DRAFT_493618 [Trichodelitschia bisporula]
MFTTFTGSSRKPRQVNLSGRQVNPFAKPGTPSGAQSAVLNAQQARERRQREHDRLHSAKTLQRVWRGYSCRRGLRQQRRQEWDTEEAWNPDSLNVPDIADVPLYASESQVLTQLQRLVDFFDVKDPQDLRRLHRFGSRYVQTVLAEGVTFTGGAWPSVHLRLQGVLLSVIEKWVPTGEDYAAVEFMVEFLAFLSGRLPELTARNAEQLYRTSALLTHILISRDNLQSSPASRILEILIAPLRALNSNTLEAYEEFAFRFLTLKDVTMSPFQPAQLDVLADRINYKLLASAVSAALSSGRSKRYEEMRDNESRLSLLGCFIYFHRHAHRFHNSQAYSSNQDFVTVISRLLASVAEDVDFDDFTSPSEKRDQRVESKIVNSFVQAQILSLVNKESIGSLLWGVSNQEAVPEALPKMNSEAKQLANYALTLLRFFPRKGDDIRMWLYLGSTSSTAHRSEENLPAIKFFWQAARSTTVFGSVSHDTQTAIQLLKSRPSWNGHTDEAYAERLRDDWRVILIFLELYTFVLKLMDDEEFFSASTLRPSARDSGSTWNSHNALPLSEVKELSVFLKNLGFVMYFHAAQIAEKSGTERNAAGLSSFFKVASSDALHLEDLSPPLKPTETTIAGLAGISIDYVKGLITGLLRMIHERDSRRKFLPKDHWLMTSRLDMESFIPDVVAEEENRYKVQEMDDEDVVDEPLLEPGSSDMHLVGTGRDQRLRYLQRLERQQRAVSRTRYLQAVAPRSQVLQNMPFFIPFPTRVQIFREFVKRDQIRRRNGVIDPDTWRLTLGGFRSGESLSKHSATIRRQHEFEDAYQAFYSLKEKLKEPIQITFVDQFGTPEAGIDGGGVTKEFLTSVTSQAFSFIDGLNMFVENEHHLLYPNPDALEEKKVMLLRQGYPENSLEFRQQMTEFLHRYEFLGRVIGKCLYEGILVDINFAGFFLLKWALTGGLGSAPRESGYRANLNDLRDLDEALYQGLIQLKNYPGDVEDFSLNFSVTDTITTDYETGATKNITRELKPGGADIPVTNENRLVYISYMARYRLQIQPAAQTSAFLKGLSTMIHPSWLNMFNQSELQTLIGGSSSSIDVADLRRNTVYGGPYEIGDDGLEHPTVQLFWQVMESFTDEERRAVLKFVTSTPRAPLLGFSSLNPRFSIRDSGDDETRLPSASTCINLLKLPRYSNAATLREKLLYAAFSGAGFDLS